MTVTVTSPAGRLDADLVERAVLFMCPLLIFWITLQPFADLSATQAAPLSDAGNLLNQLLYVTLFLVLLAKVGRSGFQAVSPLLHPAYLATLGWFAATSLVGLGPSVSERRLIASVLVMGIVGMLLLLPRTARQFGLWLGLAALVVVVVCYGGVLLVPRLAVHQADAMREASLAGDWRGVYDHKSAAGPMMVLFMFIGVYLLGQRRLLLGGVLLALATVFLLFTGAKQASGLVVFILALSWLGARTRSLGALLALCLVPLALYNLFTVGSVVFPAIAAIDARVMADPSFTNRTGIWHFAITALGQRPLTGYGFMGFWNTGFTRFDDSLGDQAWTSQASDSHNAYLDLAVTTGLPGLALALWALVIQPLRDYARAKREPAHRGLADLFFRLWLFCVFLAGLETIFFFRDAPVWVTFLIAVFGLRYLSVRRLVP